MCPIMVTRSPNEITRQQAVKETGLSAKVLLEGADRQLHGDSTHRGLRHRRAPHANGGVVILFDRAELAEDLAQLPCQWCDAPAPGDSGRCRRHQAKKYATVELVCDWKLCPREGEPFTRYGSVHDARTRRGDTHNFCSDRCEMLWLKANHPRFASPHAPFTADSARERYERLGPMFDQERAGLGLPLDVHQIAAVTHTSPAVIRTHAPELGGQVLVIDGAQQLAFPPDAADRYPSVWASKGKVSEEQWEAHRARYFDPDWMVRQQARTIRLLCDRGVSRAAAEAAVRASTQERRRAFIRRRTGRPARGAIPSHHMRWLGGFLEMYDYCERQACAGEPMLSDWAIYLAVAQLDFADHPEGWSYDPDTLPREAAARVRKGVKPLLIERTETTRR